MKLQIAGHTLDLSVTRVMGLIPVLENDDRPVSDYVDTAKKMVAAGADFVEVGIRTAENSTFMPSEGTELERLIPVIRAIGDECRTFVGVCTSYPAVMEKANAAGASFIVDPNALRTAGAIEMAARLHVPVVLCDPGSSEGDLDDPVSRLQEFFYERVDACLNGGMNRRNLIIDPLMGNPKRLDATLKMLGRISTFKSFALPLSAAIPAALPYLKLASDETDAVTLSVALYTATRGVCIIRTTEVSRIAMALAAWQMVNETARPHQLSKGIVRRFIAMRDLIRERLGHVVKNKSKE